MTLWLLIWSCITLAKIPFRRAFQGYHQGANTPTAIPGLVESNLEMSQTTCLLPPQRSKHFKAGTSHVTTSGGSLLPSLLSYYLDSMTPYGCHECPRKTRTMLTFLRHMAYGSDEPPLKDVDDTDLYQALIPYVRLSMFSFAQFGISYV